MLIDAVSKYLQFFQPSGKTFKLSILSYDIQTTKYLYPRISNFYTIYTNIYILWLDQYKYVELISSSTYANT